MQLVCVTEPSLRAQKAKNKEINKWNRKSGSFILLFPGVLGSQTRRIRSKKKGRGFRTYLEANQNRREAEGDLPAIQLGIFQSRLVTKSSKTKSPRNWVGELNGKPQKKNYIKKKRIKKRKKEKRWAYFWLEII